MVRWSLTCAVSIAFLLTGLPSRAGSGGPESLPPNELGRVMILEYHKIDRPESRWTRTPENFRRDLQRLWEHGYRLVNLGDYLDRLVVGRRLVDVRDGVTTGDVQRGVLGDLLRHRGL